MDGIYGKLAVREKLAQKISLSPWFSYWEFLGGNRNLSESLEGGSAVWPI